MAVPNEIMVDAAAFGAEMPLPDIDALIQIRDEVGPEALTPEETAALDGYEAGNRPQYGGRHENLAEQLDEGVLTSIGQRVVEWVGWDEDSRAEWREMERRGIRALGVTPNVDGGANFTGSSKAVHPALSEACVQFQSRAIESMWPAGGPVKTAVLGKVDEEAEEQASRVEHFMNYQYTELMPGSFEQVDQMLLRLPLTGSCFVKVYPDYRGRIMRRFIEPVDFIVPYRSTDLETTPRYTEQVLVGQNELKKQQKSGYYRDINVMGPREESDSDREEVMDEIYAAEGSDELSIYHETDRHTLYECYCEYDIPGFEHTGEDDNPTGIARQYIITVEKDSQRVLSIYRNWKEEDTEEDRIIYHVHYRFIPGFGFYGYGLYHWLGSLAGATTGSLRALLDAAHLANMQGGYRSRHARVPGGDASWTPGEFKEVDATGDDLSKAFMLLPFKEPSATLFSLMGHLEELSRRFSGTTDVLVGEGNTNVPVGTTLARIEQGTKVTSAIQGRIHVAAGKEYRLVAWLDSQYLADEYPYDVHGESRVIMRADFDSRVDVIPVSDPNFVSNTQRYFVSEASLDIAARNPELYDLHALHRRAQTSLRIENLDEILPGEDELVKRMGPVEENAAALLGQPMRAHLEQHHNAHLQVHQVFLMGLQGEQQERIAGLMEAHMQEHMAMAYLLDMQMTTGIQFQMPTKEALREAWQEVPVEMENQIAVQVAMAMQQMQQQTQDLTPEQAEEQRKSQSHAADQGRKDESTLADIERKNAQAEADINRKATAAMFDEVAKQREAEQGNVQL